MGLSHIQTFMKGDYNRRKPYHNIGYCFVGLGNDLSILYIIECSICGRTSSTRVGTDPA